MYLPTEQPDGSEGSGRSRPRPLLGLAGDERLVKAVRHGDHRAFEIIFERHHRELLSFCRHMLVSVQEAEDAVQQTFLNAYRALGRDERDIDLRPWLYRIARNHCLSVLRRRREQVSDEIEISTRGLAAEVEERHELREMLSDIAGLPVDQREALLLSELGTVSHAEIAGILDCKPEKVKALVFRARKSLAEGREARDTPCEEIREQLSVLRGGSLRRTALRRHLADCQGCRAFRDEVRRQRAAMAIMLPVVPSVALKALSVPSSAAAATLASGSAGAGTAGAASATAATASTTGVAVSTAATALGGKLGSIGIGAKIAAIATAGAVVGGGAVAADRTGVVNIVPGGGKSAPATPGSPMAPVQPASGAPVSPDVETGRGGDAKSRRRDADKQKSDRGDGTGNRRSGDRGVPARRGDRPGRRANDTAPGRSRAPGSRAEGRAGQPRSGARRGSGRKKAPPARPQRPAPKPKPPAAKQPPQQPPAAPPPPASEQSEPELQSDTLLPLE